MEQHEKGSAYWHTWKGKERHTGFWWGNLQERDCLADRHKWKDNIKMNFKEAGWEGGD